MAPAVAPDQAVGRAAQDLLVGRDPLDAVLGQQRDHRLADRALARPHPTRPLAESIGVALDGAADVHRRILGIPAPVRRQRHVGHRLARQGLVEEQGEDRMIIRRRGQLHLATFGQLAMQRDHLAPAAIAVCPGTTASPPRCRCRPLALNSASSGSFSKSSGWIHARFDQTWRSRRSRGRKRPRACWDELFHDDRNRYSSLVAVVRPDHRVRKGHEEVVEDRAGVVVVQAVGRASRERQMRVGRPVDVGVELGQQARHQVDRAAELGDLLQMQGHPQVILGRVQPDPGHGVLARDVIGVVRLVLMPHDRQGNGYHRSPFMAGVRAAHRARQRRPPLRGHVTWASSPIPPEGGTPIRVTRGV